MNNTF